MVKHRRVYQNRVRKQGKLTLLAAEAAHYRARTAKHTAAQLWRRATLAQASRTLYWLAHRTRSPWLARRAQLLAEL